MEDLSVRRFFSSTTQAVELCARIFKDNLPDNADAIYAYGCAKENEESVLLTTQFLAFSSRIKTLVIPGHGPYVIHGDILAYSGEGSWREALKEAGIKVKSTKIENGFFNTYTESLALIRVARENDWKKVIVVAFPGHIIRAFTSAVTAVRKEGWCGRIYACSGATLPWLECAPHSQDSGRIMRRAAIQAECDRLDKYNNLLVAREVLDYLNERDLSDALEKDIEWGG